MTCMPWGTVTYSPQGWKRPRYLLTDVHLSSFGELMNGTDWEAYGPKSIRAVAAACCTAVLGRRR